MDIYTDCAGSLNDFGVSFVILNDDNEEIFGFKTSTEHLNCEFNSSNEKSSTSIGECYAIYKALSFIKGNNKKEKKEKRVIYTDNLHVFLLLNKKCKCKKKNKTEDNNLLLKIANKCKDLKHNKNVEIRWIKAHIGIYGNEIADTVAKLSLKSGLKPDFKLNSNFLNEYKKAS